MTHSFYIDNEPFQKIANGRKTIELRLNDKKRQAVKINDKIIFTNRDNEDELLQVVVTALHSFDSFSALYANLNMQKCGYSEADIAKPEDMRKYYSRLEEKKHGVVGIEFKLDIPGNNYSCGLVLEGGGFRGLFTSGVLDAFMEEGIKFPYVIGVSAGSCNGVSFIANNYHRIRDIIINYANDKRYMSLDSVFKNGELINSQWVFGELSYDILPLNYDNYENADTTFCVVTTNASTGKSEYFYPTDFRKNCDIITASSSMPIVQKAVKIGKDYYYDGGVSDSIPLKRALDDGCEKCVVILTQDDTYVKQPIGKDKIIKLALKKYPMIAKALLNRHNMYNEQKRFVAEKSKEPNIFKISPEKPLNCPTMERDKEKLWNIYNMGYRQGKACANQVKEFLKD